MAKAKNKKTHAPGKLVSLRLAEQILDLCRHSGLGQLQQYAAIEAARALVMGLQTV